jgi:hypothetical protein
MRGNAGAAIVALALAAVAAWSAELTYLSADEVRTLILGKTVEVQDASGATFRVYFDPDGRRLTLQSSGESAMPWRILPDGNQCVTTAAGDDCARIASNGDGTWTRYRAGSPVNRWLKILPGKALAVAAQAPLVERRPTLQSAEESRRIQEEIRARTEAHFRLLAANRLDEAYAQVDARSMGQDEQAWKRARQSFQALAGEPVKLSIIKVTVYDNPAEAAQPGLYVAADYSNEYRNVPVHCGYLMWFRPIGGGEFRVTREETGHITAEQLGSLPAAQLPAIKQSLRCVAP